MNPIERVNKSVLDLEEFQNPTRGSFLIEDKGDTISRPSWKFWTFIKDIYIKEPQNSFSSDNEAIACIISGMALTLFTKSNDLQLSGALFLASAGSRKSGVTNMALTLLSLSALKHIYKNRVKIFQKIDHIWCVINYPPTSTLPKSL